MPITPVSQYDSFPSEAKTLTFTWELSKTICLQFSVVITHPTQPAPAEAHTSPSILLFLGPNVTVAAPELLHTNKTGTMLARGAPAGGAVHESDSLKSAYQKGQ